MPDGFTTTEARSEKRPLYRPLPPALPYPIEALGPLRPAAEAVHLVTQAPIALCAQSVLAAAALAVQAHHDVILPGGGRKPLTQIFVSIAESGERKSSVDRIALHAVYQVESKWREQNEGLVASYLADLAGWKEAVERAKKNGKGNRAVIRSEILSIGSEPKPPPHPMLLIADPTPEALVLHLAGRPWAGVFTAEGGILVGGSAFNDESRMRTGALFNTLWDGEPIRRRRVQTGSTFLPGRRCSAHIMLQPVVADELLGDDMLDGMGMLARMLVVAPDSTAGTRMFKDRDASAALALADYDTRLRQLLEAPPSLKGNSDDVLDPEPLECSAEARELWIVFHDFAEAAIGDGGEWRGIRAFGAKAAEHAGRLAAVLAAYAGEHDVSAEMMACGINLAQHYAAEMIRLKGGASITPELKAAQRLLDWWQDRGHDPVHLPEIYQYGPSILRTAAAARAACRVLQDHGWIAELPKGAKVDGRSCREALVLLP
jgi:hypothetical protein